MIQEGQLIYAKTKGMIPIEELKIGDSVYTGEGHFAKVINIRKKEHRGITTTLEYFRYNIPLICDNEQLILIHNDEVGHPFWQPVHRILPNDLICMPKPQFIKDTRILPVKKAYSSNPRYKDVPKKIELSKQLLELFGTYLAEGCCSLHDTKGKFISISGHTREMPLLERIAYFIQEVFGVNSTIYKCSSAESGIELRAYSIDLALWFSNLFEQGAKNKRIPDVLMELSPKKLLYLSNSYISGDGYRRKNQAEFTTVSSELGYQMILIFLKSGLIPNLRKNKKYNVSHWVGGYTLEGLPSNSKLNMQDQYFVYHPVKSVSNYKQKKKAFSLQLESVDSVVVGQCTLRTR